MLEVVLALEGIDRMGIPEIAFERNIERKD